jgi:electron transfer flavoprotein alpha subunit
MITPSDLHPLLSELLQKPRFSQTVKESTQKLPHVLAVGEAVREKARGVGERVTCTDKTEPAEIVSLIKELSPDAVLFPADLAGRRIAPVVAATLKTGLCADCTALETDGQTLFMWRPAKSGSVIAKIKCVTAPQMATVRVAGEERSLVLSGGRGVADQIDKMEALANRIGAELCVSRTVVDLNLEPYEMQVGLTGKNANAKVYIAVGISGAVQHTCALDGCDTVIAVNPDRNARIFDHADYGIVGTLDDLLPLF